MNKKCSLYSLWPVLLAFLVCSCVNPFGHRDPEEPSGHSGHWEVPSASEIVIVNLEWAYQEGIIQNFSSCFADSYRFLASHQDSARYPETFSHWDLESELAVTNALFTVDTIRLLLEQDSLNPDYEDDINGTAELYRRYDLIVSPSQNAPDDNPARGVACFLLQRNDGGNWAIFQWSDFPDTTGGSLGWALLKAEFQ
ncbi:hypothetical protein JW877_02430 [bacterium]|nr:hypothetical protein [bacterium]